ncbi:MAG: cytochrome ubiquinol oxidase subunit I [Nocardioides sp.]|uniref:cytochrome ubiquinol oxidase subunit I n=1 Tax=Nocardioides sp. TaxID=35761 RepID=UPI0039E55B5D
MDSILDIARWQFGITTVYHFLFVPLTIGLTALVAVLETCWLRAKSPERKQEWLRLTKFFAKLFLINFALGLVTGIVQEFQFGMNWSDYSRFVGDVFGAPLAVEALLAFFLESTFLGLWIFGWDRLPRGLHAACMWLVHLGTLASAWFILAANSWMQHPVGYAYDEATGRAELTDFWAVMFNKVQLATFPHVILASYMTAALFVAGICGWRYWRDAEDRQLYRRGMRFGSVIAIVAFVGVGVTGDVQGKVMTEVQPMKMAAAEALWDTSDTCAPFSVLTIGTRDGKHKKWALEVPCVLSFLATGHFDQKVEGINQLRETYQSTYGSDPGAAYYSPDDYTPIIPITYWSFRWMMGLGAASAAGGALLLWLTRKGRVPPYRWIGPLALSLPVMALAGNSVGWIFTEMGRQPWVVFGLMTTRNAVSPGVSVPEAWISVIALTLLYGVLAVIEVGLLIKVAKAGAPPFEEPPSPRLGDKPADGPLTFAY